jgi:hypothetical protein
VLFPLLWGEQVLGVPFAKGQAQTTTRLLSSLPVLILPRKVSNISEELGRRFPKPKKWVALKRGCFFVRASGYIREGSVLLAGVLLLVFVFSRGQSESCVF